MKLASATLLLGSLAIGTPTHGSWVERFLNGLTDTETCEADLVACQDELTICLGGDDMGEEGMEGGAVIEGASTVTFFRAPPDERNICEGVGPKLEKVLCVETAFAQAGANVTVGYQGELNTTAEPITTTFFEAGLCPVNVHWHRGTEHLSVGEYDENGTGPAKLLDASGHGSYPDAPSSFGYECNLYDASDPKFTTNYTFQHCKDMVVGETYEVHWPHSAAGACGTPNQYQTPFLDGVFCRSDVVALDPLELKAGVQAQVFVIVNDESYYYPDLMRGMIVDGDMGKEITKYTGSTTGSDFNNVNCSQYSPLTWQVDRKCHLISASSFDKMCADMKAQRSNMEGDMEPHGSRVVVSDSLAADNHQNRAFRFRY